jgi:hypothetical protein
MISKRNTALISLALMACASTAFAQTLLLRDDFDDGILTGWIQGGVGQIEEINHQFVVSGSFGPAQTNSPTATHASGYRLTGLPGSGPLPDSQTMELRADLVGANQNDTFAGISFLWVEGHGYLFQMDQGEVAMMKYYTETNNPLAIFFWENLPLKNQNVTLVLSLTCRGSNVMINTRVLDRDNANTVLFDRTVVDTPQSDLVLPNRAVRGFRCGPDLLGTPWPAANAPGFVSLVLTWTNPERAPQPAAQVIFDNLEVWQYESPQLAIQNAVVLSWPVTQGEFVLESASTVNGPWEAIAEPWSRIKDGKTEVSILAPDSLKLFRLRQAP